VSSNLNSPIFILFFLILITGFPLMPTYLALDADFILALRACDPLSLSFALNYPFTLGHRAML
jgi:hypothetical protein